MFIKFLSIKGQTSVEYALCLVLMFFIAMSFYILIDSTGYYRGLLNIENVTQEEKKNVLEDMYSEFEYSITRPFP